MPIRPRSGRSRVVRQRKSCCSSVALGMLEAEDLAALRIDAGHHVPDGAVFSGRIHRLKDQQDGMAVGCVVKLLQRAQLRNVLFQKLLIVLLRLVDGLHFRRPFLKVDFVAFLYAEVF